MSTWERGFVRALTGKTRLSIGQRWGFFLPNPDGTVPISDEGTAFVLPLTVTAISPEGEVVLRPVDRAQAEAMFPEKESVFKGKPMKTRSCPFHWKDGNLLAHEAWDVWTCMHALPEP